MPASAATCLHLAACSHLTKSICHWHSTCAGTVLALAVTRVHRESYIYIVCGVSPVLALCPRQRPTAGTVSSNSPGHYYSICAYTMFSAADTCNHLESSVFHLCSHCAHPWSPVSTVQHTKKQVIIIIRRSTSTELMLSLGYCTRWPLLCNAEPGAPEGN